MRRSASHELVRFLEQRAAERSTSAADRLRIRGIVDAYHSGRAPRESWNAMVAMARRFADHPAFRHEWLTEPSPWPIIAPGEA
jgi:hypothetical protein